MNIYCYKKIIMHKTINHFFNWSFNLSSISPYFSPLIIALVIFLSNSFFFWSNSYDNGTVNLLLIVLYFSLFLTICFISSSFNSVKKLLVLSTSFSSTLFILIGIDFIFSFLFFVSDSFSSFISSISFELSSSWLLLVSSLSFSLLLSIFNINNSFFELIGDFFYSHLHQKGLLLKDVFLNWFQINLIPACFLKTFFA